MKKNKVNPKEFDCGCCEMLLLRLRQSCREVRQEETQWIKQR